VKDLGEPREVAPLFGATKIARPARFLVKLHHHRRAYNQEDSP